MKYIYGSKDYLMHHGIKGQQWGVQNGPPYPLDEKDHSASEKKADNTNDQNKVNDKLLEKQYGVQIQRLDNENEYYKVTKAQITKNDAKDGPSIVNGKEINQFLKDKDYDYDMMDHISDIGCKALEIYDKDGTKSALDYLNDNLKNVNYTIRFSSEIDKEYDGEPYSTFFLVLKDNNGNGYGLSGEYDYVDDEYFLHHDMNQEDKNYLMHHGIKGQSWGVQNGPPYPLNPDKDYSTKEKKANFKEIKKTYNSSSHPSGFPYSNTKETTEVIRSKINNNILEKPEIKKLLQEYQELDNKYKESNNPILNEKRSKEVYNKAYPKTIEDFKKNDPIALQDMINRNGGSDKHLEKFPIFDTILDGYSDLEYQKMGSSESEKIWRKRFEVQQKLGNAVSNSIVGEYGNKRLSNGLFERTKYKELISMSVADILKDY